MGWRNIALNITFPAIAQCQITDFSLLSLTSWPADWSPYVSTPSAVQSDFNVPAGTGIWTTVMGSDVWRIDGNISTSGSATIHIYMQGYPNHLGYGNEFVASGRTWGYVAAVNDETQMGFIAFLSKRTDRTNFGKWAGTTPPYPNSKIPQSSTVLTRSLMYTLLTGNEYHQYHWQSVPIIGSHSLSVINDEYINNGEEVTDAPATNFDLLEESTKLSALAEGHSSEFPVIESSAGKMTIKDNGNGTCDLRFYLVDKPFLKIAGASKNAYLSILQDTENQVAKPSIIYEEEE